MSDKKGLTNQVVIESLYLSLRSRVESGRVLSVLDIGSEQTLLATGTHDRVDSLVLEMGAAATGLKYFHHEPPTPEEVENAINVVEDELTRIYKTLGKTDLLYTDDTTIRNIALMAGVEDSEQMSLSRELMEALFTRFAALSLGRPMLEDNLPVDAPFAAKFLILREVMHHLGFKSIEVIKSPLE